MTQLAPWWAPYLRDVLVILIPSLVTIIARYISHREHASTKTDVREIRRIVENGNGAKY